MALHWSNADDGRQAQPCFADGDRPDASPVSFVEGYVFAVDESSALQEHLYRWGNAAR
jgi:hypothetical protein